MITSSTPCAAICAALVAAQTSGEWVAIKEHRGEKGAYASLTDILAAVLPQLAANKIAFVQHFGSIRETKEGSVIGISTRLLHSSGEWLDGSGEFPLSEGPTTRDGRRVLNACQAGGASVTYAKRYALAAMLGLPLSDDRDDADRLTLRDAEPLAKDSAPLVRPAPGIPEALASAATHYQYLMSGAWQACTYGERFLGSMKAPELLDLWSNEHPDNLPLLGFAADFLTGMLTKRGKTWADIDGGEDTTWPAKITGCTPQQLKQAISYVRATFPIPEI